MRKYRALRGTCLGLAVMGGLVITAPALGHVGLNDPNGGETLEVGSEFTIEWQILISHDLQNWDLWYSTTSNVGPWTVIAEDLPPGNDAVGSVHTYDWTVPDVVDSSVWVRVRMDNSATDYYDESDSSFEIVAPVECVADTDGSGTVDTTDLLGMLSAWGTADPTYDIAPKGGDGVVNVTDLLLLLSGWGDCPS